MLDARSKGAPNPGPDSLATKLRIICAVPGALAKDAQYIRGVPSSWPEVGRHLEARLGFDFPFLSGLNSGSFLGARAMRAIAAVLIDNYETRVSFVGVATKVLAGRVFARVVGSHMLLEQFERLAAVHGVAEHLSGADELAAAPVDESGDVSKMPMSLDALDPASKHWLLLARAIAPSPAAVGEPLVETLQAAALPAQGVVELVNFVAVAQLQLRINAFYPASCRL
jgi:hypothetical protein